MQPTLLVHIAAGALALVSGFVGLLWWLWRVRIRRSSRGVVAASSPEAAT